MRLARFKALTTLQSQIVTKKGSSTTWTTLHNCLVYWSENQQNPPLHRIPVSINLPLIEQLKEPINEQGKIGWQYAFWGYLSHQWARSQWLEHPKSTEQGIRQQWLKPVICEIWTTTLSQWTVRNTMSVNFGALSCSTQILRHQYRTDQVIDPPPCVKPRIEASQHAPLHCIGLPWKLQPCIGIYAPASPLVSNKLEIDLIQKEIFSSSGLCCSNQRASCTPNIAPANSVSGKRIPSLECGFCWVDVTCSL